MLLRTLRGSQTRAGMQPTIPPWGAGMQSLTGPVAVNESSTLSVTAAFRCVQLISDSIGRLPLQAFRNDEQIDTPPMLKRPETDRTRMDTVATFVSSLLIHGNAYALVADRDYLGFPTAFVTLSPRSVSVKQLRDGSLVYVIAGRTYDEGDVLHIRGTTLPGHHVGLGVIEMQRRSLAQSIAAEDYAGELWTTGAVPDGVLETPADLSPAEATNLKTAFLAAHAGRQRSPAVLSGGITYRPIAFSNVDLEMLESRKWNAVTVCQMFGVPPFLAGVPSGESKTYQNVQQDKQAFVDFTLAPWLGRIEESMTAMMEPGTRASFNIDAMLRADTLTRYQAHKIGLDAGFLSVDEARGLENLLPMPQSDDAATSREIAEMIQKIYLGVDVVLTADEARAIVNRVGADLTGPAPRPAPVPAPLAAVPDTEDEESA